MSEHGEGHKGARERLGAMTSLEEILETAMSFEESAEAFYSALRDKVGKPLRELVGELALEEAEHFRMFKALRENPDIADALSSNVQVPADDHNFSKFILLPDLGPEPDDQAILQYALSREDAAARQYGDLAQSTPEGPVRDLFVFLANEELEHKAELEKRYYELVHSGGV
ncbi:MAG TPA: rubrerythrin [Rhizobiales bacterium]|nr:rubrerythrin [Hyphomicrobiales bacterium]